MAERRMFAKTIIDSDAFLDMPLSAQALYFHLSMRADDDGFINNPRKIQRTIGCGNDDLKLLFAKNFVIPFESGIVVIKHWKIHNYIQKDRYKPTMYQEEKAQLNFKVNKAYTLKSPEELSKNSPDTKCIQDVSIPDTQSSLELELVKSSLELELEIEGGVGGDPQEPAPPLPPPPPLSTGDDKSVKHKHGEFKRVRLTDVELNTLTAEFGSDKTKAAIDYLDAYIEEKGYKSKSHYLAIRRWVFDAVAEREQKAQAGKPKYGRKEMVPGWVDKPSQRAIDAVSRMMGADNGKTVSNDPELAERAEKLRQQLNGGQDLPDNEGAEA